MSDINSAAKKTGRAFVPWNEKIDFTVDFQHTDGSLFCILRKSDLRESIYKVYNASNLDNLKM